MIPAVPSGDLGEWAAGGDAYPSGDGTAGGDFRFAMNVLPGDINRSGVVLADDFSDVKRRFFRGTTNLGSGDAAYGMFHDVDGSGAILANDFSEVKRRFFDVLPAAASVVPPMERVKARERDDLLADVLH